jgi:hypothetical protein
LPGAVWPAYADVVVSPSVPSPRKKRKIHAHPVRGLERMILGIMMTIVAYVVERRLLKTLKREGTHLKGEPDEASLDDLNLDVSAGYDKLRHAG